MMIEILIILKA